MSSKKTKVPASKRRRKTYRSPYSPEATLELASCAVFALKFLSSKGSGVIYNFKTRTTEGTWQDKFFNALDSVGIEYDREQYFDARDNKKKRRKRG